jgi:L-lactate dehydrogenase complex protein LldE
MVNDKCGFIEKANVDAVVATDAGCLMNVGGCLRRRGGGVRTLHLAEVLAAT